MAENRANLQIANGETLAWVLGMHTNTTSLRNARLGEDWGAKHIIDVLEKWPHC